MKKPSEQAVEQHQATNEWLKQNPAEIPIECVDEAESFGIDTSQPESRNALRELLEMDPDLFGDWDRFQ